MPLIVETGAGLANANSYISLADANTYFADRGVTAWDLLDDTDQKTPALINAAEYMRRTYGRRWLGVRSTLTQRLDWPRYGVLKPPAFPGDTYSDNFPGVYLPTQLPEEVRFAQADIAYKLASGIELDSDLGPPVIEETVGPITTKYAAGARQYTVFTAIANSLAFLLKSANSFEINRG